MSKISDRTRDLLQLVERSKDVGQGWRHVSDVLWPHVQNWAGEAPELFELRLDEQFIRLSPEGTTVLRYL